MADRKLQYIIEMIADDNQLRKQMKGWNWANIMGASGKSFGDMIADEARYGADEIRKTFKGLNVDWTQILGTKEIGQLEQSLARSLQKNKMAIQNMVNKKDAKGIQDVIDLIVGLGKEFQTIGSNFDAGQIARSMNSFMKVLTPLTAKFEALADEPKKVEAAFDRLFSGKISDDIAKVAGGFTVIGDAAGRATVKVNKSIETMEAKLASIDAILSEDYGKKFKFDTNLKDQFYGIDEAIEKVETNIDQLSKKFNNMSSSDKSFEETRNNLVQLYTEQIELYRKLELIDEAYTKKHSKDDSLLTLNAIDPKAIISEARTTIETIVGDARRQLNDISTSTKTTKDGINIPIKLPSQAKLVKTINNYVKSINDSNAIHGVRLKLDSGWLNDAANVIEDKTTRAYGDNPADFDKNTTDLVNKTKERFDSVASVINDKLNGKNGILATTKDWRQQMLAQFKFDKEAFSFKFDDKLIEQLNDMFEDYQLKLSVDAEFLSNQIKTVLENSSISLSGGTANISPDIIMKAAMDGVKLALLGGEVPATTSSTSNEETVVNQTDKIADDIVDTAKHLDIAEEYVQDVVKKIQEVARYATKHIGTEKDSKGAISTREKFKLLGIDLEKVNSEKDGAAIAKMLEDALLPIDEFGDVKGVAVVDELSKFKDSSSKTISAFLSSLNEVFYNLQISTLTAEEWVKKQKRKEVFDAANEKAKAARSLQTVRSAIKQGDAPSLEEIDKITADMSAYWTQLAKRRLTYKEKDIEALALDKRTSDPSLDFNKSLEMARQEIYEKLLADIKAPFTQLREARIAMGDATEGESVEAFRETAQSFYTATKQLFVNLKKQAEEIFKGTVFVRGKNGLIPKQIEKYKDFASVKDDAVIVDVEVNSTLNDVALGVMNGKYSGRPSAGAEKQMIRGQHSDLTVPKRYEKAILERTTNYSGFKPKGTSDNVYDLDNALLHNQLQRDAAESAIQAKEAEKNTLDQEMSVLEQTIAELSEKNKKISNSRKKEAQERIKGYKETISQLSVDQSLEEQHIKELESNIKTQNYYKKYAEDRLAELPEDATDDLKQPYIERINKIDDILNGLTTDLVSATSHKKEIDANIKKAERGLARTQTSVAILIPEQLSAATSQRDALAKRRGEAEDSISQSKQKISELDAMDAGIRAQKERNKLRESALILEGEIQKLEADGASRDVIEEKKAELLQVNQTIEASIQKIDALKQKLADLQAKEKELQTARQQSLPSEQFAQNEEEAKRVSVLIKQTTDELRSIGGFLGEQPKPKEYSVGEKKTYALEEIKKIDEDLITAKAQLQVAKNRLAQVDKKLKELETWKLEAGYGAIELAKIKREKEREFKSSVEYKSFEETLVEKIRNAKKQAEVLISQATNTHRDTFNEKVTEAMIRDGLNPYDKKATKDFLKTKRGQQLATQYEQWVEEDTTRILDQYNIDVEKFRSETKELQQQALEAYKKRLVDGDLLDYREIRENLKRKLEEERAHRKQEYNPDKYQAKVNQLETDRKAAIAYGGVSKKEILSPEIIQDQIRKQTKLDELLDQRIDKEKELKDLEMAGVPDSDDSVKQANKEKERLDKEIARYEMIIRSREKLVEMRYDESKELTYTDEEKELLFTNRIIGYNQKIENSLAKQEELKKKIATASEEEKTRLQYTLKQEEDKVAGWRGQVSKFEGKLQNVGAAKSKVIPAKTGEVSGGLLGIIKEAVGSVDLTKVEEILSKILAILSGNGVVGTARNSEMDAKLARIKELEAKQQLANEQKKTVETVKQVENAKKETSATTKQRGKVLSPERDAFYESELKYQPKELIPDKAQEEAVSLKKTLDEMYTKGEAETVEFMNQQVKLANLLSALRSKLGKGKAPADEWKTYVSELLGNTDNVLIGNVGKRDYKSKLKALGVKDETQSAQQVVKAKQEEVKAEVKITEEKKKQEQIRFTRKEKKELNRLKSEVKDYNPDSTTGLGSEFGGFATENTLKAILGVLNKISTSGVPKSGGKTKNPQQDDEQMTELERRVGVLKGKFKDAISVGYLDKNDAGLAAFNKQLDDIENSDGTIEQLEEMRKKALALGDVINKTISRNKRLPGINEIGAVERQRINIKSTFGDDFFDSDDIKAVEEYDNAYKQLIADFERYKKEGTLYNAENQDSLRIQATRLKENGKTLSKSLMDAQKLEELVENSGSYQGKQLGGKWQLTTEEANNLETSMKSYLQTLGLADIQNIKFNNTNNTLTASLRTSNKTVSDLEMKYNDVTGALYAYQKQEKESLTGLPAFIKGFKGKIASILQYTASITSIYRVVSTLRQGIQYVREIDSALTELKKVTDETEESYDRFLNTAAKTADKVGSTIKEVVSSTADFARLGYSLADAAKMAENAQLLMNVSEFTDISSVTDTLISAVQAFSYTADETLHVVDILNKIGNSYAISTADLASSLTRSSAALVAAGGTLEEAVALTAAANTIIQDADSVGNALKVVSMRIRGTSTKE